MFSRLEAHAFVRSLADGKVCRTGAFGVRGMPQDHNRRKAARGASLARAAHTAAIAAFAVCAGTAIAWAGDNDGTISQHTPFYTEILKVIGIDGGPAIDYSPRSPLVVPPTRYLPPPQPDRPPLVAGWPKDPDMTRSAAAKERKRDRRPIPDYAVVESMPLRPDQLNAPLANGRPAQQGPAGVATPYDPDSGVERQKTDLFSFIKNPFGSKTEYATFTGEPDRTSLTDPPPGYLTPSPDQPYGIAPTEKRYKIPTVADRVTPSSGSAASQ
jgi:hypothetical protein